MTSADVHATLAAMNLLHRAMGAFLLLGAWGCGSDGPRPTTFGGDRLVELKVPANLEAGKEYPLLVVLHGYGATGFAQSAYFGVTQLATSGEVLLLAPDGTLDSSNKQFWNADPACCDFEHKNPDDVGYIGGLIDDVLDTWPVDRKAVYLLGHSNGGYMSYRMACERADVITDIGVLAGIAASVPADCQPTRSVNVLHLHGTADDTVPYDGGGVAGSGAVASVAQWATHDGCGTTRTPGADLDLVTSLPGAETHTATTDGCPAGVAVDLWTLEGAGHVPGLGSTFTPTVMQWFTDHRRS